MDQLTALLESVMLLGQLAQDIALVKGDIRQVRNGVETNGCWTLHAHPWPASLGRLRSTIGLHCVLKDFAELAGHLDPADLTRDLRRIMH